MRGWYAAYAYHLYESSVTFNLAAMRFLGHEQLEVSPTAVPMRLQRTLCVCVSVTCSRELCARAAPTGVELITFSLSRPRTRETTIRGPTRVASACNNSANGWRLPLRLSGDAIEVVLLAVIVRIFKPPALEDGISLGEPAISAWLRAQPY